MSTKVDKPYEVRNVTMPNGRRTYAVVEKATTEVNGKQVPFLKFVGNAQVNYIYDQNAEGLAKANEVVKQLIEGKKVK